MAAVAARIGERLPVSQLARSLGVSRRTLELRFRAEMGVPIGEAILDERLARAKDLLRTTSLSCERIAAACGIYDANHLGHLFRRKFGASPSSFRKRSSGGPLARRRRAAVRPALRGVPALRAEC